MAWLRIPGTKIDYPVMHGADNRWYLSHDFLGREATAGAVFLDYRNRKDFSDMVMIIYGHRMNGDLMFSDVAKYSDDNYFSEHSSGELYLRSGEKRRLRAVVFSQIDSDDGLYDDLALPDFDEPVVVLSTCDRYEHEKRDVLIMKIEEW